jgi:hypothetical protein
MFLARLHGRLESGESSVSTNRELRLVGLVKRKVFWFIVMAREFSLVGLDSVQIGDDPPHFLS